MLRSPMLGAAALAAVLLAGCLTIPVTEDGVFEDRRTVTPADFDLPGLRLQEVRVPVEGGSLDAWWMPHDAPRGTVLYFGGQGFLMVHSRDLLASLSELGLSVLLYDYRGYGRSDGTPSTEALREDALVVYDFLADSLGVDPAALVLHGHSMGTFLATATAEGRPAAALVMESPVTSVRGLARALVPALLRPLVRFDITEPLRSQSNMERLPALTLPTLVLVGEDDSITPERLAREVYAASAGLPKRLAVVPERGHNDLVPSGATTPAYEAFLREALPDL